MSHKYLNLGNLLDGDKREINPGDTHRRIDSAIGFAKYKPRHT